MGRPQGRRARMRLLVALSLVCSSCMGIRAVVQPSEDGAAGCAGADCKYPFVRVCNKPTMHTLAKDLDELEKHIDKYGSVVAKVPDVWGEARLTKYREEFEKEMASELTKFAPSIQASLARSDQAYFANALALSAAISGRQAGALPPRRGVVVQNNQATQQDATPLKPPDVTIDTSATGPFGAFASISRNEIPKPPQYGFAALGDPKGLSVEPTVNLEQKQRYLNYLAQLRRNNEGDDIADSPGYSLNLMRIPVSVLPGACTDRGYGAEITFTLTPQMSDELLPATFRQLVTNDLVDQLGLSVTKGIDALDDDSARDLADPKVLEQGVIPLAAPIGKPAYYLGTPAAGTSNPTSAPSPLRNQPYGALRATDAAKAYNAAASAVLANVVRSISTSRQRVARLSFPSTQLTDVLGQYEIISLVTTLYAETRDHRKECGRAYNLDVEAGLQDELRAAYDLLAPSKRCDLWKYCGPEFELAKTVRGRHVADITKLRESFMAEAGFPDVTRRPATAVLAWAIVVESALLNDQLAQDLREAAAARGCACNPADGYPFYLPNPPAEARHAFNEYVRCRWPIHVFALDPEVEEQNIADVFSMRREMQLSLSLAFVSGNISAQNMTRFARRIEADYETVALNRTQVGFSHGEDTFGWRFYPRFQTPDIESNLTVLTRDLLIGGPSKNAITRQQRLEPGMRECVAVVMMPSFVPYLSCEESGNWFKLTCPKCKEFTTAEAVRLGRVVKAVQTCSPGVANADCYRDGDLGRLQAKTRQLEARLPLQNMTVQVPNDNTIGGFAMFNSGVTDLAPQLRGWYGAPGVRADGTTSLFLVGNHFSVHQTRVIAGGAALSSEQVELLSRQVMRVTIPKETVANLGRPHVSKADQCETYTYLDIHVATPYGVTAHMEVPVIQAKTPAPAAVGAKWAADIAEVSFVYQGLGIAPSGEPQSRPPLKIQSQLDTTGVDTFDVTLTFAKPYDAVTAVISVPVASYATDAQTLSVPGAAFAGAMLKAFATEFGPEQTRPPVPVTAEKTSVTPKKENKKAGDATPLVNKLSVMWVKAPVWVKSSGGP